MKVQEKLDVFHQMATKEAKDLSRALLKKNEAELQQALNTAASDAHQKADKLIQEENSKLSQIQNKELAKASMEAKKTLINLREQSINRLFGNVKNRLLQFVETPEYGETLQAEMQKVLDRYPSVEFTLMTRDVPAVSALQATITETEENFIGGFRAFIRDKNASIDSTYLGKLEEERKNKSGGLG